MPRSECHGGRKRDMTYQPDVLKGNSRRPRSPKMRNIRKQSRTGRDSYSRRGRVTVCAISSPRATRLAWRAKGLGFRAAGARVRRARLPTVTHRDCFSQAPGAATSEDKISNGLRVYSTVVVHLESWVTAI